MKLPNLSTEPVAILVGAAILVAAGVELGAFTDTVERIVQAVALVGGTVAARGRVWPAESVEHEQRKAEQRTRAELAPDKLTDG